MEETVTGTMPSEGAKAQEAAAPAVTGGEAPAVAEQAAQTRAEERQRSQSRGESAAFAEARRQKERAAQKEELLLELRGYLQNHPDLAMAREASERLSKGEKRLTEETQKTQKERARLIGEEGMRAVSALDAAVRTVDDLIRQPNYAEIRKLVMEDGYSIIDAFKKANEKKLDERKIARARQQVINGISSKAHLRASSSQGGEGVTVPNDVAENYRRAFPGITEAEILKKYKRFLSYKRE